MTLSSTTEPTRSVGYDGLAGRRTDLRHDHEPGRSPFDGRQQQEIGEAEVGEWLPRRGQPLDVTHRLTAQRHVRPRLVHRCDGTDARRRAELRSRGAKRWSPIRASPATSAMSDSKFGTLTTTSGRRDSSARSSASRARDDFVVAERVAERPQHPRGRRRVGERGIAGGGEVAARAPRCRAPSPSPPAHPPS